MSDGVGITQFLKALGEIARGAESPTVPPVWNREILRPRAKPTVKFPHHEYHHAAQDEYGQLFVPPEEMNVKCGKCTTFEALSACLWQSRTKALNLPADQDSTLLFPINGRSRIRPPLPDGYYGNVIFSGHAKAKARDLTDQPLSLAVKLINEAKRRVNEEYMRSMIDFMEVKGHPHFLIQGSYIITDLLKVEYAKADFGWGKAVFAGSPSGVAPELSNLSTPLVKDFHGIAVPVCLPSVAMEIFEESINNAINWTGNHAVFRSHTTENTEVTSY